MDPTVITAACNMVGKIADAKKESITRQSETEVKRVKKKLEKGADISEQICEVTEQIIDLVNSVELDEDTKKQFTKLTKKYARLHKKFLKNN